MKNKLICSLSLLVAISANAAQISFSNFNDGSFAGLAIVDSSDVAITSSGTAAIGYFSDEAAAVAGDFSSWQQLGAAQNFAGAAAFGIAGLFGGEDAFGDILTGSSFVGENITIFITNGTADEWLVAKSSTTFALDNPVFTATVNLFSDVGITYLWGGAAGADLDYGVGLQSTVQTQAVPEPSAFAAMAGLMALGFVMVRRRG